MIKFLKINKFAKLLNYNSHSTIRNSISPRFSLFFFNFNVINCISSYNIYKCDGVCVYKPHTTPMYDSHLQNVPNLYIPLHIPFIWYFRIHPASNPLAMRYKKIPNRDFIRLQQYDENAAKNSSQFNSLTDTTLALSIQIRDK